MRFAIEKKIYRCRFTTAEGKGVVRLVAASCPEEAEDIMRLDFGRIKEPVYVTATNEVALVLSADDFDGYNSNEKYCEGGWAGLSYHRQKV